MRCRAVMSRLRLFSLLVAALPLATCARAPVPAPVRASTTPVQVKDMMVRISEIEIDPAHLDEYKSILAEESAASVRREPGVISIFPMYQKEQPTTFRIVEIYASREAYESHLKTAHFQEYKTGTLSMVRSLKLVDMTALDEEAMARIFAKMKVAR